MDDQVPFSGTSIAAFYRDHWRKQPVLVQTGLFPGLQTTAASREEQYQ